MTSHFGNSDKINKEDLENSETPDPQILTFKKNYNTISNTKNGNNENIDINNQKPNNKNQNIDPSNNKKFLASKEWLNHLKKNKYDLESVNKALLSNAEFIDSENIKLKETICELVADLKDKDNSLDESLKLINKLKANYTSLFHQFQSLEEVNLKLNQENDNLKKVIQNNKNSSDNNKQNDFLKEEINKLKRENQIIKNNNVGKANDLIKITKEKDEMKLIIEDLKQKNNEWMDIIKEREKLIEKYNIEIQQLNNEINAKNEQLKLLVKFSKNINDENKLNVKELTKQACQTIKLLYNYSNSNDSNSCTTLKQEKINIKDVFNFDELFEVDKCTMKLKEAFQDIVLVDDNNNNINIKKEFIYDINIKMNLLKLELFSCYLRELNFASFFKSILSKLGDVDNKITSDSILETIGNRIKKIKDDNEKYKIINIELRKNIYQLKNYTNNLHLLIDKLKNDIKNKNILFQGKINRIFDIYDKKISTLKNKYDSLKSKYKIDIDNLKYQFSNSNKKENTINNNMSNKNVIYIKNKNRKFENLNSENIILFTLNAKLIKNKNKNNLFDFSTSKKEIISNSSLSNNSFNTLTFQQKDPINKSANNDSSFNENNYKNKKIENEKLKDEISRLKNEMANLLQDMNKQQRLLSEGNNKNNNSIQYIDKNEKFLNSIIRNIPDKKKLIEINNMLLCSPDFDNNIKDVISNIFDVIMKLKNSNNNSTAANTTDNNNNINTMNSLVMTNNSSNSNNSINKYKLNELNQKIFSTSELKKFHSLYNIKNYNTIENNLNNSNDINSNKRGNESIKECIILFSKNVDYLKKNLSSLKLTCDSTIISNNDDLSFINSNNVTNNNQVNGFTANKLITLLTKLFENNTGENISDYRSMSEEIIKLKNFKIVNENLIELVKHFLMINEKIYQFFILQKYNKEKYRKYLEKIFEIFSEGCCYNIDEISDNDIFHKKLILKLFEIILL